ncbi:ion transporter [bacterium]|nr:ion transporter [bacterium]
MQAGNSDRTGWRRRVHEIIFEADTPAGKAFDIGLILSILGSIVAVMLESVEPVNAQWGAQLRAIEWFFTVMFTIEYVLRIITTGRPLRYVTSFYGIVDLVAILPTYISMVVPGGQYLLVVRALRLLRVFRVLRLVLYLREGDMILQALRASGRKITVFLFGVLTLVTIIGALMYMIEGPEHGFESIPLSMYWAVVTLTTVGYGDIAPQTVFGKLLAGLVMITGYAIIAVPTGIVTAEMARGLRLPTDVSRQACPECSAEGHAADADYCRFCGAKL